MNIMKPELLKQVLNALTLQPFILLKDFSNLPQIDRELRMHLYEDFSYDGFLKLLQKDLQPGQILVSKDRFGIWCFAIQIPDKFLSDYQSPCFLSGPFLTKRLTVDEIRGVMKQQHLPDRLLKDLSAHYNLLPVVDRLFDGSNYLENLVTGFFECDYKVVFFDKAAGTGSSDAPFPAASAAAAKVSFPADTPAPLSSAPHRFREDPRISETSIEERYHNENRLLDFVRNGNYQEARKTFDGWNHTVYIPPRTENRLRDYQNFTIILATLLRKAAEQGGVPPLYIDDLSSRFSIRINEARSTRELDDLRGDMIHRYCLLVQNHSMKGLSPAVRSVVTYIDFHYAEPLSLRFFAEQTNLSRTYLSGLFKKEMGVPLTDYLHSVRMRQAMLLINSGSVPMAVIASSCGYSDPNYFIRMFKQIYGMTPKQYQQSVAAKIE